MYICVFQVSSLKKKQKNKTKKNKNKKKKKTGIVGRWSVGLTFYFIEIFYIEIAFFFFFSIYFLPFFSKFYNILLTIHNKMFRGKA